MSFIRRIKKGDKIYLAEVENSWLNGKCVQRYIRYVGKVADGKTILSSSISNVEIDQVKLYGPLLVLHHLASEIHLADHLGPLAGEILSLAYAHCLDYKSINQMPRWFERTDLNMMLPLEKLTEDRLLKALDSVEETQDLQTLQKVIFAAVQSKYHFKDSGIIYDVTNTYLYGKNCPLGKMGHDKEGVKGRSLIQIGLGVTRTEGIPVFHKTFHGNGHDARTLQDLITGFAENKIKTGFIVFDRGVTSQKTVKELKNISWNVVCGVALRGEFKPLLRSIIRKNQFVHLENRVHLSETIFYVITQFYKWEGIPGSLAWCFNEQQKRDLRESRYDEILHAQKLLGQNKVIKPGLEKFFNKNGQLIPPKLSEAEELDGYSCIFSTERLSKKEMLSIYFGDKDIVEKAFHSLKGVVNLQPIRHWLYNRVTAHVFICYLSYLLLALLKYRLRKLEMSPMEALTQIETMYKVYMKDAKKKFSLSKTVTLTKKQELILKTIDKNLLKS
ncbi:MAG: transposase [Acidobacteria bacterium]|nr:transposase [Acidobacteriota bacterium]MBI3654802.1 transposase [Acidobacteriota bacterium]